MLESIMRHFLILLSLVVCGMASACSESKSHSPASAPTTQASTPAPPLPRELGKVVSFEAVSGTQDASFAYYLPPSYTIGQPIPVLIFFDSHARGKDPVTQYQALADQYHVLLVGSNNSKNGQQPNQGLAIYDQLMADLKLKFKLDEKRITVSGFSGGARVAAAIAQSRPEVGSVIACSAGFQPRQGDTFNYMAIIGKKDFNFQELRQLEDVLDGTAQRHIIQYWEGGHEWPSAAVMGEALEFVTLRGMEGNNAKADSLAAVARQRLAAMPKANVLARWRACKAAVAKLDGLADVTAEKAELAKLQASPAWAAARAAENKEAEEEMALREEYVPQLGTKSVDEWRTLTGKLNPMSKPQGSDGYFLRHRVLNFLSLNTYFQIDGALKANALPTAEHFLEIYKLVDPPNAEGPYLTAQVRMRQNRPADAMLALQAAQTLGFKDADRLASDPEFAGLRADPQFVKLLEQLRAL